MPMHKGGKSGNKKHGRNKAKCERYRRSGKLEKRKIRNLRRFNGLTVEQARELWFKTRKRGLGALRVAA